MTEHTIASPAAGLDGVAPAFSAISTDDVRFRKPAVTVAAVAAAVRHAVEASPVGLARLRRRSLDPFTRVGLWHVVESGLAVRPMGTQD
jgi:hypothetical protein